jgi:hypothetical protein
MRRELIRNFLPLLLIPGLLGICSTVDTIEEWRATPEPEAYLPSEMTPGSAQDPVENSLIVIESSFYLPVKLRA